MNEQEQREDMMKWVWCVAITLVGATILFIAACCEGCMASPQKKGTVTMADRGAKYLTEKGDPFMETGIYAQRNVSPEFAAGVEKGLSDAAERDYWSMRDAQRWLHFYYLPSDQEQRYQLFLWELAPYLNLADYDRLSRGAGQTKPKSVKKKGAGSYQIIGNIK